MELDEALKAYYSRTVGTLIRGQKVESVELCIDTNGEQGALRYFLHVHFVEPELPVNMRPELKMWRRITWDTDYAMTQLQPDEVRRVLEGDLEIPDHQWTLSDEFREL